MSTTMTNSFAKLIDKLVLNEQVRGIINTKIQQVKADLIANMTVDNINRVFAFVQQNARSTVDIASKASLDLKQRASLFQMRTAVYEFRLQTELLEFMQDTLHDYLAFYISDSPTTYDDYTKILQKPEIVDYIKTMFVLHNVMMGRHTIAKEQFKRARTIRIGDQITKEILDNMTTESKLEFSDPMLIYFLYQVLMCSPPEYLQDPGLTEEDITAYMNKKDCNAIVTTANPQTEGTEDTEEGDNLPIDVEPSRAVPGTPSTTPFPQQSMNPLVLGTKRPVGGAATKKKRRNRKAHSKSTTKTNITRHRRKARKG